LANRKYQLSQPAMGGIVLTQWVPHHDQIIGRKIKRDGQYAEGRQANEFLCDSFGQGQQHIRIGEDERRGEEVWYDEGDAALESLLC
jgi:hypothetical protein